MPLAWLSRLQRRVYHGCLDCGYLSSIHDTNVVVKEESWVQTSTKRKICDGCFDRVMGDRCRQSSSRELVEQIIIQHGGLLRVSPFVNGGAIMYLEGGSTA